MNEEISQSAQEDSRPKKISTMADDDDEAEEPAAAVEQMPTALPENLVIYVAEPIVDRKSIFVGRAVRITNVAHVRPVPPCRLSDLPLTTVTPADPACPEPSARGQEDRASGASDHQCVPRARLARCRHPRYALIGPKR